MTTDASAVPGPARRSAPDRVRAGLSGRALTRALTAALWLVVGSSAAAGFIALARVEAVRHAAPAAGPADAAPGLEGFAALYVASWLENPLAAVEAFYPGAPALGDARSGERYVVRSAAVAVVPGGEQAWTVTVGAEVLVAAPGGYRRDGLRHFEAAVARRGTGFAAASLPREVPAPAGASGAPAPTSSGAAPPLRRP
jgi:hypothetical protein